MPRLALALIALCACTHAAPRRPAPAPVREEDRALVAATTLLDSARGDELLQLASAIPPALRRPLAFHLLRTRAGQCRRCLDQPVTETGALASPCARDQVIEILLAGSPLHAAVPHDILRAAATASDQLVATLGDQLPTDQLVELWSALDPAPQDRGWMVQTLAERLSANQVAALFRSRPSTALLPVLDPIRHSDLLIATATDRSSTPHLRAAAARRLREAASVDRTYADRLLAMFHALAADPDCDVAAAAIEGLRWLGVPSVLPVAPQTTSAATLLHTVCVAAKTDVGDSGYQADMYRTYVGPAGITVVDTSIQQHPVVDHVDARTGPIYLVTDTLAGATCKGTTCTDVVSRVDIELGPDPSGRLWITKLVRIPQPVDCAR